MRAGFLKGGKSLKDNRYLTLFVETQSGKHTTSVTVDPNAFVRGWKSAIASILSFTPKVEERIGLTHNGDLLEEDRMASEYKIPSGATLTLVMKPSIKELARPEHANMAGEQQLVDRKTVDVPAPPVQTIDDSSTEFPSEGDAASSAGVEIADVAAPLNQTANSTEFPSEGGAASSGRVDQALSTTRLAERKRRQRKQRAAALAASTAPLVEVDSPFSVIVQTQKGQRRSVEVKASTSVDDFVKFVEEEVRLQFSLMNLHLSFNGKQLGKGRISEYGICAGSVLTIIKDGRS